MSKSVFIIIFCCLFQTFCNAQPARRTINEIKNELNKSGEGEQKVALLLELGLAYVYKPGEQKVDLDSALLLAKSAESYNTSKLHDKAIEAKVYFTYSNAYREKGDTARGHLYINNALSIYKTLNLPNEEGEALLELTSYMPLETMSDVKAKRIIYDKAYSLFVRANNLIRQGNVLKDLADFDQLLSNYGLAINELNKALNIYQQTGKKDLQGIYDLIGIIYTTMGDFANGVTYGLLATKTAEQNKDTSLQLCTIYSRLGVAYGNWGKYDNAATYQKKALDIALKYQDANAVNVTMYNLVFVLNKQFRWKESLNIINETKKKNKLSSLIDSIYFSLGYTASYIVAKDFPNAKPYVNYLLSIRKRLSDDYPLLPAIFSNLTNYYAFTHDYERAEKYAADNIQFSKNSKSKRLIAFAYFFKSRADSVKGDYLSSLRNFQKYKDISDSMLNDTKTMQMSQSQALYDMERKDDSLKLTQKDIQLLKKQNDLQEADLSKANLIRNIIIVSALLLILLLYIGYRFKQRSNNKLQAQQKEINQKNEALQETVTEKNKLLEEKEWLVKEIHHRVKNNLQIVISLLNTQSRYLDSEEAKAAIRESRHRMQAMSLIHQKLYQSENTTSVDMQTYVRELVEYLQASFYTDKNIAFHLAIDEVELDLSQAISVGLILNEAITNAIKYAFVEQQECNIFISMSCMEQQVVLSIKDDGIGLPADFDINQCSSMGMRLINGLTKQINGKLHIENKPGAYIRIDFDADIKLRSIAAANSENKVISS